MVKQDIYAYVMWRNIALADDRNALNRRYIILLTLLLQAFGGNICEHSLGAAQVSGQEGGLLRGYHQPPIGCSKDQQGSQPLQDQHVWCVLYRIDMYIDMLCMYYYIPYTSMLYVVNVSITWPLTRLIWWPWHVIVWDAHLLKKLMPK